MISKKFLLNKKNIFLIGGYGLIGKEVVKLFLSHGAKIVILDNAKKNFFLKKNCFYSYFDCAEINVLDEKISKLVKKFGLPDALINCSYPRSQDWSKINFSSAKLSSVKENIDSNLISQAWISRIVAEKIKKKKKKCSIVHLSSIYGVVGQDPEVYKNTNMRENLVYSLIKGGIINYSRLMASYYGKYNIRVNTIVIGGIKGHVAGLKNKQSKIFIKNYSQRTPLKRLANPDEIAPSILFLASDASSYITGSVLTVDGGWTAI
jgi:NAD(P)-dependent dehydrogenase (short-subunit alcohol dehydrogenase family)